MTRDELLTRLAGLRRATVGQGRAPHKPLLLLWLFGQFAAISARPWPAGPRPASGQRCHSSIWNASFGIYTTQQKGNRPR
jgi:hypothetical protein